MIPPISLKGSTSHFSRGCRKGEATLILPTTGHRLFALTLPYPLGLRKNLIVDATRFSPDPEKELFLTLAAVSHILMFVSFLINKVKQEAFRQSIQDYTRYGDLEGAMRRGTGMNLADLEQKWLVYLKLRVSWIPIITSVSTLWFITALIFVYGYARKQRQAERRLKEMEKEEESEEWYPTG